MAIKVIVLDFDGVIVESNDIKHGAFSEIFSVYPDHYKEIMAYHFAHNAVNRHEKFKHIMINILNKEYDVELAKKWALRFSELTTDKIINCPYVTGAIEFIKSFSDKYPVYLASATPIDELKTILKGRKIFQFFAGVYGAPMQKRNMFYDIMKKEMIDADEILYIGDSPEDYETARASGCIFIARTSDYEFKELKIKSFKNMLEIKDHCTNNLMIRG